MYAEAEIGNIVRFGPPAEGTPPGSSHRLDHDLLQRNNIVGFESASEDTHAFSVLRSQVLKHAHASGEQVFATTSVQPGNGKTHVAVNLAAILSRIHPTILVELDLRRPSVGARIGLPSAHPGVEDYLSGQAPLRETAVRVEGFDLVIHRARCPVANPEKLLASARLADMINMIRNDDSHPICIIDTPPGAIHHDDIMLIAPVIDGILMVVEEGRTSKHSLVETIRSLSPTPVIGSVLNRSISSPRQTNDYDYYYALPLDSAGRS